MAIEADEVRCPTCEGRMWDNRLTKRNPKAPDFKCRDKGCEGVIWPPRDGEEPTVAPPAATKSEDTEVQVMLDLETMGTASNAAICSIGAVKFSLAEGILDGFYVTVDLLDCKKAGLQIQKETVEWWSKQNPKA